MVEAIYHEEGRATPQGTTWQYEYSLKDHLGNTRVIFTDANGDGTPAVIQESDYYPFGMQHASSTTATNHYLYNGKELDIDLGLNWYHYGFRMYDAAIGKFTGVDPISDQFPWVSTYNYAENMPTIAIDLHGLQAHIVISGQKNPGPTPATRDRGYDNKYIKNNGDAIANKLGYSAHTYSEGVQLLQTLEDETSKEGYIQNLIINAHGTETGLYGAWNASFYSDNLRFDEPREQGVADVGDLVNKVDNGTIKFANDATVCFLSCRAGKEHDSNIAQQITLETGVTTIGASAGVNRNDTGSKYIYRAGKGSSYYNDTEAIWYKFERVNDPVKVLGITLWNNYSIQKTQIGKDTDLDLREYMQRKN